MICCLEILIGCRCLSASKSYFDKVTSQKGLFSMSDWWNGQDSKAGMSDRDIKVVHHTSLLRTLKYMFF